MLEVGGLKKIKVIFAVAMAITLATVLIFKSCLKSAKIEKTEFLFDSVCSITVFSRDGEDALCAAFDEATRIHSLANFFDDSSDVSKINRAQANQAVKVDKSIIEMIETAGLVCEKSGGAFDITLAPVSHLWKFNEENPVPPTKEQISAALDVSCKERLMFDKTESTVTKKYSGTKIDLGGIAKGYAADRAAEVLKKNGTHAAIIDFGGNIVALGKNPKRTDGLWKIGLQTPFAPTGECSEILEVASGAVVTSGNYQRFFEYQGKIYHHIIDPETGTPAAQNFDSVTVQSKSSAISDCIATAAYVLGEERGKSLAEELGASVIFLRGSR